MEVLISAEYYISKFLFRAVKIRCAWEKLLSFPVMWKVDSTEEVASQLNSMRQSIILVASCLLQANKQTHYELSLHG